MFKIRVADFNSAYLWPIPIYRMSALWQSLIRALRSQCYTGPIRTEFYVSAITFCAERANIECRQNKSGSFDDDTCNQADR